MDCDETVTLIMCDETVTLIMSRVCVFTCEHCMDCDETVTLSRELTVTTASSMPTCCDIASSHPDEYITSSG